MPRTLAEPLCSPRLDPTGVLKVVTPHSLPGCLTRCHPLSHQRRDLCCTPRMPLVLPEKTRKSPQCQRPEGTNQPVSTHWPCPPSHMPHAPARPRTAPCGRLGSRNVPLMSTPDTCSQASLSCRRGGVQISWTKAANAPGPTSATGLGGTGPPAP